MNPARRPFGVACLFAVLLSIPALGTAQLRVLETRDLQLVYLAPNTSYLAPHVARCFQNAFDSHRLRFRWQPEEKITLVLTDFADYGNAGAGAVPRDGVAVSIAPMSVVYETYPASERMFTLMNHELVHVAAFDAQSGRDGFFRRLFSGKVAESAEHPETFLYSYLTAPRTSAPRWFHEGIATFVETWMAGGIGRAQGSYDEMVFRSMVRDSTAFEDPLGLVAEAARANFQLEMNSYLYGTRFMSWLALTETPDRLIEWVRRGGGSRAYHASQFDHVFGRSLEEAWRDWVHFEHRFQQANLDSIRQYPVTQLSDIGHQALGSVSRSYLDPPHGKLYAALNYPGVVAHVAAIDLHTGAVEPLAEVKGPMMYDVTSLAFDSAGRRLFYTADNGAYRDIVMLDLETNRQRVVLEDARIGELVFDASDTSLWGIRHADGFATLVHLPIPWDDWRQVHTFDYGEVPYDLDVSGDGSRIAFARLRPDGRAAVEVHDRATLLSGQVKAVDCFDFGTTVPMNFVFEPGGHTMIGTSYLTGVSNVFRYDLERNRWQGLSNVETGVFRPVPAGPDSLVVFRYSGQGFVPAVMAARPLDDISAIRFLGAELMETHPELREWRVGSPAGVPLDSLLVYDGEYRALGRVGVEAVYPVVEGYKSYPAYGLRMDLSDPISLHQMHLTASYSPNRNLQTSERWHGEFRYERYDWLLSARYDDADFYDLFGPTRVSRKGWSVALGNRRTLVYDAPRELGFSVDLAYYGGLEKLPDYQNVSSSFSEFLSASVRLEYTNLRFSIGAVDYEKGNKGFIALRDGHVNGRSFPSALASWQGGVPLGHHSSVWIRTYGGVAPGERDEPFANFFFGGFGNNWIDHGDAQRYRQWYAFPGFELNELGGTNFARLMLDFNLPPLRFSRLGRPALYASWARASLFASGLYTNFDDSGLRRGAASLGVQVDVRWTLLSHRDLTLSFGYAVGLLEDTRSRDEFMASLRIH